MPPVKPAASSTDDDTDATAELPVLDVAAYEATLDDPISNTDTWVAPTAVTALDPSTDPARSRRWARPTCPCSRSGRRASPRTQRRPARAVQPWHRCRHPSRTRQVSPVASRKIPRFLISCAPILD